MEGRHFIAILTDFGLVDPYVGIMKSVIRSYSPDVEIVDLTNLVPRHSVLSSAYLLYSAWDYLPPGAVVLGVVDPGVGSSRRELISATSGRVFVGPDNGMVSMLVRMYGKERVPGFRAAKSVLNELADRKPAYSHTFDGRDLFSPLAARAAVNGVDAIVGDPVDPIVLPGVHCVRFEQGRGTLLGHVLHVDHFGNIITSIHESDLRAGDHRSEGSPTGPFTGEAAAGSAHINVRAGTLETARISLSFSDVPENEPVAYIGSTGFLELAVRNANAAARYEIDIGDSVTASHSAASP